MVERVVSELEGTANLDVGERTQDSKVPEGNGKEGRTIKRQTIIFGFIIVCLILLFIVIAFNSGYVFGFRQSEAYYLEVLKDCIILN